MNADEFNEMIELIRNRFHEMYNHSNITNRNYAQDIAHELISFCVDNEIELE